MADGTVVINIFGDASSFEKTVGELGAKTQSALSGVGSTLSGIGKGITGAVTAPLLGVIGAATNTALSFLQIRQNANTAFTVMLGGTEQAQEMLSNLYTFAKQTPFKYEGILQASQSLIAMGMDAQKVIPTLTAVGDAAAASGKGSEGFNNITEALGKMQAAGKVSMREIHMLSMNGIQAVQILANKTGVSVEEMRKKIESGTVGANEAIDMLVDGITNGTEGMAGATYAMGGMMANFKQNFTGAVDSMTSAWRSFALAVVGETGTVNEATSSALDAFTPLVQSITALLNGLGSKVGETGKSILPIINTITGVIQTITDKINAMPAERMSAIIDTLGVLAVAGPSFMVAGSAFTKLSEPVSALVSHLPQAGALLMKMGQSAMGFASKVMSSIPGVGNAFSALGSKIAVPLNALKDGFNNILSKFPGLQTALQAIGARIGAFAAPAAGAVVIIGALSAGIAVLAGVAQGAGLNIEAMLTGAVEKVQNFGSVISGAIDSLAAQMPQLATSLANTLPQLAGALTGAINNILMSIQDLLPLLVPVVTQIGSTIITTIISIAPQLIQTVLQVGLSLLEAIIGMLPSIIEAIAGALPQIIAIIVAFIPQLITVIVTAIPQILAAIVSAIPTLIDSITQAIPLIITAITEAIPQIITAIVTAIPLLIEAVLGAIPQIITALITAIPLLIQAALQLFLGLVTGLVQALPQIIQAVIGIIPNIITALIGCIGALIQAAVQLFTALIDALPIILPPLIDAVIAMIPVIVDALISSIDAILQGAIQLFTAIINALPIIIPKVIDALIKLFPKVVSALIEAIPQILQGALQLFLGIVTAVGNAIPQIIGAVGNMLGDIFNKITSFDLIQAGKDLIGGLINGIKDMAGKALKAVTDIGNNIVNGFKGLFGIHSPSRLMAEFGGYIDEGLALGISRNGSQPVSAMQRLSGAVQDAFDAMASGDLSLNTGLSLALPDGGSISYELDARQNATLDGLSSRLASIENLIALGQTIELDGRELGRTVRKVM